MEHLADVLRLQILCCDKGHIGQHHHDAHRPRQPADGEHPDCERDSHGNCAPKLHTQKDGINRQGLDRGSESDDRKREFLCTFRD